MSIIKLAFLATISHPGYKPWMKVADLMLVIALITSIGWWLV